MESLLWALNLVAVAGLCLWFLRQDKLDAKNPTDDAARADDARWR